MNEKNMKRILLITFTLLSAKLFCLDRLVDPNLSAGNGTTIFTTITSAINASLNGDNIIVVSSTYNEPALILNKSLKIAPQTPGTTITFNANINIAGYYGMKLELLGLNLGVYSFIGNTITSGPGGRANVSIINCTATGINFDQNYYQLNLIKSTASGDLRFRFGKIAGNNLGNCYLNDEPSTNVNSSEIILIVANNISNETQLLNDDYCYVFTNNYLKNLRVQKWVLDVTKTNYITNNDFVANCELHFAVLAQNAFFTSCYVNCDQMFPLTSYNFKFENNLFAGTVNYTNKNSGVTGGNASNHYSAFRYGIDYYSSILCNFCTPSLSSNQAAFPNANSSGFFSWTYNGNSIPCATPSGGQPLNLTRIIGPVSPIDGGNPNHDYYDIDLTINNRGRNGGPYTIQNFNFSGNNGNAYVYDLEIPADLFPGNQISINSSTYHSKQGTVGGQFYDVTGAEYFFGVFDPGAGQCNQIASVDGLFDTSVEDLLRTNPTWTIGTGPTLFNIRAKDANNNWGPLYKKTIFPYGVNPNAQLIAEGDTIKVCPNGNVTLNYDGPNGYTPTWFNGSTGNTVTFSASNPGYYGVVATLGNSSYSDSIYIGFLPAPAPTVSPSGSILICASSVITLTTPTQANTNFQWFLNGSPISGATLTNYLPNQAGNYYVRATSTLNGCKGFSDTTKLITAASIVPAGSLTTCNPPVVLSTPAGTGNNYQWKLNGINISGATSPTYSATTSGNYAVTITNGSCVSTSPTTSITIASGTPTITANGSTSFCQGGSVTLTSSSASNNTWSNGATTQSIVVYSSGNYSVSVSNGNCPSTAASINVIVNPIPPAPTITLSGPTTFCQGGSVTLTSSNATGNVWSNGANSQSITINSNGNYSVTFTDANGCSATSALQNIISNPLPNVVGSSNAPGDSICSGNPIILTGSGANTYSWSGGVQNGISFNAATTQTYTVTGTDVNGCTNSDAITITVNACLGNQDLNSKEEISIYPNPTENTLNISFNSKKENLRYAFYSNIGQLIFTEKSFNEIQVNENTIQLDLHKLSNGVYFLNVYEENSIIKTFRVLVNK